MSKWVKPEAAKPALGISGYREMPGQPEKEAPGLQPADLYARWAMSTDWRGFARDDSQHQGDHAGPVGPAMGDRDLTDRSDFEIRIIAQLTDAKTPLSDYDGRLKIPGFYKEPVSRSGNTRARHFTATLKRERILELCERHPELKWELAVPRHKAESIAQATTVGRFGP